MIATAASEDSYSDYSMQVGDSESAKYPTLLAGCVGAFFRGAPDVAKKKSASHVLSDLSSVQAQIQSRLLSS